MVLMKWDAVFFDFDGAILDSVEVKTKAFARMFRQYGPEVEKSVVEYHLNNGGVSRFDKFRYYYEKLLKKPVDEETIKRLSEEFTKLVIDEVLASPFMPGAEESLKGCKKAGVPCYIVSATPHDEINLIAEKKGLKGYFNEIHGAPRKKLEICHEIVGRKKHAPQNCLFIGDAMSDYDAACKNKIHFMGIVTEGRASPFPNGTHISHVVTVDCRQKALESPLITVIVATKNRAGTLQRCIDSISGQTWPNKQLIVIDGGSCDETVNLLKAISRDIDYWESNPDRGIAHAWNKALKKAKGEWLLFVGADDYLAHPGVLEEFNEKLKGHRTKSERVVYAAIKRFFPSGDCLDTQGVKWSEAWAEFFTRRMTIPHPGCFHHRSLFSELGAFDESFFIASDYEFLLRVLNKEDPLFLPDFIVTHMTFGGISSNPSSLLMMQHEVDRALKKHGVHPRGIKRRFNILTYNIINLIDRVAGRQAAAGCLDMIRLIQGKPPVWTRK
jgi:glycosyltransferase involved in cell wall biosynthesis/phosphoglycolate phosphatase-like HAD superfamily hydrolase